MVESLSVTDFEVPEDSLRQALLICSELRLSPSPIIVGIASATLRQLLTVLYDRVEVLQNQTAVEKKETEEKEKKKETEENDNNDDDSCHTSVSSDVIAGGGGPTRMGRSRESLVPPPNLTGTQKHAYMLFQDLCLMGKGESGVWLGRSCMKRTLAI